LYVLSNTECQPFLISIRKHLHLPSGIGKLALEMIKSMYKSNSRLLGAITDDDIRAFFFVPKALQDKLPDFLSVFCCANNDQGITSNQAAVLRFILDADFVADAQGTPRSPLASSPSTRRSFTTDATGSTGVGADSDEMPSMTPSLQSAMSHVLAVPATRMVTPFIPKLSMIGDRVMIDASQNGDWTDFEEWFPPNGFVVRGATESKERTRHKDHIRASLWLLRSLCLDNR
jgi:hypothetical protein